MKKIIRALIEVDNEIHTGWCDQYEHFESEHLKGKYTIKQWFKYIVVDAAVKQKEVWEAIVKSDEVWMDTSFIGNSGELLVEMLKAAKEADLKNKTLINMREYSDAGWHIPAEAIPIIKELKSKNKIKFVFSDNKDFDKYFPK